jgi:hypothetical protein
MQDYARVQQFYEHSLRQAAKTEVAGLFRAGNNDSTTYKGVLDFLAQPSLRHPMATPGLRVVLGELSHCHPLAYKQFAEDMAAHLRSTYGRQAAAAEHTLKVERMLEHVQQRTLDRMKAQ